MPNSGLMQMPEYIRNAGEDQVLTEGDVNSGQGIDTSGFESRGFVQDFNQGTEQILSGLQGGGAFGPGGGAIGLMTKPEWFRNVYGSIEKAHGSVSPEIAQRLRDFIDQYPAEVLDKLKWFREVPKDLEKTAMPQTLGRYWDRDVRRGINVGKYPQSTYGIEAGPEEWKTLQELSAGTEGSGYFARTPPSYFRKESAAREAADTHFHETLHHFEKEMRQNYAEDLVRQAGGQLSRGEPSPYFEKLMSLWNQVKGRY